MHVFSALQSILEVQSNLNIGITFGTQKLRPLLTGCHCSKAIYVIQFQMGLQNSVFYRQEVTIRRWSSAQVWLYLHKICPVYTSEFNQRKFAERRKFWASLSLKSCRWANSRHIEKFLFAANSCGKANFSQAMRIHDRKFAPLREFASQNSLVYMGL